MTLSRVVLGLASLLTLCGCQQKSETPQRSQSSSLSVAATSTESRASGASDPGEAAQSEVLDQASAAPVPAAPGHSASAQAIPSDSRQLRAEAEQFFEDLIARVPNSPDAWEVKARFHLLVGETQRAQQCWQQALKLAPDYTYAQHGLGKVALLNGDLDEAITTFTEVVQRTPNNLEAVHDLADALQTRGELDEAIHQLQLATERHPTAVATWVDLGQAYLAAREFEHARQAFSQAQALSPGLPQAQHGLGTALIRLGQREEGLALLESQKTHRSAGAILSEGELFDQELREITKRYLFAARVYAAAGDQPRAEQALRRATQFQPRDENTWGALLDYYQQTKQLDAAVATALDMCRQAPDDPSRNFTLGVLYQQQGDLVKARQQFQKVVELAPTNVQGYNALLRLLIGARQDLPGCIPLAEKLITLRGSASDWELLAQVWAVNGRLPDARTSLQRAIDLDPKQTEYRRAMEQLLRAMNEKP